MSNILRIPAWILIGLVKVYQHTLGHIIGGYCRFQPTCSNYSIQALQQHGAIYGTYLTVHRICRCHPWGGSGHDPVPPSVKSKPGDQDAKNIQAADEENDARR